MSTIETQGLPRQRVQSWAGLVGAESGSGHQARARVMGVFPGEGIGPEVVAAALLVLDALEARRPLNIERITGGPIGLAVRDAKDGSLGREAETFCSRVFAARGVIFSGPGGGRFVYDLRDRFALFCKIVPIKPSPALLASTRFRPEALAGTDLLIVRDNAGGIYQGRSSMRVDAGGGKVAEHVFSYSQEQVEKIISAAARLACTRRRRLHVIVKDGGIPGMTRLWREAAEDVAGRHDVELLFLNVDHAAYRLIQEPRLFDVIVTPNMIGDILADLAAVFLGSRGLSFSGNFAVDGAAVYQTGHGAAYDLAGTGRANPVAQILSLAMMLRESFAAPAEAAIIEAAVEHVWRQGWRTDDLAGGGGVDGDKCIGLQKMAERIAEAVGGAREPEGTANGTGRDGCP